MRVSLIFPPRASPTYVPLSLASLLAFLTQQEPTCQARVEDINLSAWDWVAAREPAGAAALDFFHGQAATSFYQQESYLTQQGVWGVLQGTLDRHALQIKRWLSGATPNRETAAPLAPETAAPDVASAAALDPETAALLDALIGQTCQGDPEIIGFSLFSLAQLPWALGLAARIKGFGPGRPEVATGPRILLGGAACAALDVAELLTACPFISGVIDGEGEAGLLAISRGATPAQTPGLAYLDGTCIQVAGPGEDQHLVDLPAPDFGTLLSHRYLSPEPVLPLAFSRGCAWRRCRFCSHPASFSRFRSKSISGLVDELEAAVDRYGARHFYFADLYLGAADLGRLAGEILRRGLHIHYHVMARPTAEYTPALLERAAASGCRWISWGVETGSQRLLDLVSKGTRVADIERVLAHSWQAGISNLMMMIYGLPTSTPADLDQTLGLVERVYDHLAAMTGSAFVLSEGTSFGRHASASGLEVSGRQRELTVAGRHVHSRRLAFRERSSDGSLRPPCGATELDTAKQRRRWLGPLPFLEGVACEHYLLFVTHAYERGLVGTFDPLNTQPEAA